LAHPDTLRPLAGKNERNHATPEHVWRAGDRRRGFAMS